MELKIITKISSADENIIVFEYGGERSSFTQPNIIPFEKMEEMLRDKYSGKSKKKDSDKDGEEQEAKPKRRKSAPTDNGDSEQTPAEDK